MKDAVLDGGIAFNKAHGKAVFEYIGTDPRFNKVFNNAMSNHSTIIMKRILETYKGFEGLSTLVDVGGGTGAILNMIISKYPKIKGINFDLPHVIADAPEYDGINSLFLVVCVVHFNLLGLRFWYCVCGVVFYYILYMHSYVS